MACPLADLLMNHFYIGAAVLQGATGDWGPKSPSQRPIFSLRMSGIGKCARNTPANAGIPPETGKSTKSRKWMAGGPGFEPRLTESESVVLPLNYPPRALQRPGPNQEPAPPRQKRVERRAV